MKRIVIESPYRPDINRALYPGKWLEELHKNVRYARACVRYALVKHRAAPFASHLLYAQPGILDDTDPEERLLGIEAGLEWARVGGEESWFFVDRGMTEGMEKGEASAKAYGRPRKIIELGPDWERKWLGPTRNRPI